MLCFALLDLDSVPRHLRDLVRAFGHRATLLTIHELDPRGDCYDAHLDTQHPAHVRAAVDRVHAQSGRGHGQRILDESEGKGADHDW